MSEAHDRLLQKLDSIATLTPGERAALAELPFQVRHVPKERAVVEQGDRPGECCLVLDGLLCSYNLTAEGVRQITSLFVPGDMPDLQTLHLEVLDHSVGALAASRLAFVSHSALATITREHPGVAAVLWRETLITGCIYSQWVVNCGRRSALARVAHLLCELYVRLRVVGLASEDAFELPLTQAELGDAAGLSTVHVNRVLQELRGDELIVSKGRLVHIPDWERLQHVGQFDPTYLHLTPDALKRVPNRSLVS
jgi:CRP-like cAMP-binding protein